MGGSDPKPLDVAESSPLRVLWIVLPLLAFWFSAAIGRRAQLTGEARN